MRNNTPIDVYVFIHHTWRSRYKIWRQQQKYKGGGKSKQNKWTEVGYNLQELKKELKLGKKKKKKKRMMN